MCNEQSQLLLRLCDVGLAASWLSTVLGAMAKLAAVAAGVVSCRLVPAGGAALGTSAGITLGTSSRPGLGVCVPCAACHACGRLLWKKAPPSSGHLGRHPTAAE